MTTSQSPTSTGLLGKRLQLLREELNASAVVRGSGARVVLYVKTLPGEDPTEHFQRLRDKAAGRGWTVHSAIHDDAGGIEPATSEAWRELVTILSSGSAQGVLAPTYRHISMDTWSYANALHLVAERRCFTSLLIPEPST
ncbi:hypothetical protein [Streptomyces sp. NPDC004267]|uniref:hypothetical protein n=1 Tax=Streptomyces sp. NPDC004267 TaxID=3364694 RepID=UPI00369738DD